MSRPPEPKRTGIRYQPPVAVALHVKRQLHSNNLLAQAPDLSLEWLNQHLKLGLDQVLGAPRHCIVISAVLLANASLLLTAPVKDADNPSAAQK